MHTPLARVLLEGTMENTPWPEASHPRLKQLAVSNCGAGSNIHVDIEQTARQHGSYSGKSCHTHTPASYVLLLEGGGGTAVHTTHSCMHNWWIISARSTDLVGVLSAGKKQQDLPAYSFPVQDCYLGNLWWRASVD